MNNVFLTSDPHYGHKNILKYCNRPWTGTTKMDNALIDNWNQKVGKEDLVYLLGDFSLSKNPEYIKSIVEKLNGEKHLILGNHDELNIWKYLYCGFRSVHTSLKLYYQDRNIYLNHDPAVATTLLPGELLLHGHVHELWSKRCNQNGTICLNVGVDVRDFRPIEIDELLKDLDKEDY